MTTGKRKQDPEVTTRRLTALEAEAGPMPFSIAGLMAGLIAALGLVALVVVIWRL